MNKRKTTSLLALILAFGLCLGAAAANAPNAAPVAENQEFTTYKGVSFEGKLTATDPEGQALSFEITTKPVKGAVELQADGQFVYTPAEGKKGKDYFGFKAVDEDGNRSQEGTVIIKISRKDAAVTYSDLSGNGCYLDAVMLAEKDVFTGEKVGATYLFEPERPVTRGQFLSMCMELADSKLLSGVMSTGFNDDNDIPVWQKPYVSTAVMNGSVDGYAATSGGAIFDSSAPVTRAEAAVMLNNITGMTNVANVAESSSVPTWAAQSVANLTANCIIPDTSSMSEQLTRAQAAKMLVNALDVLNSNRK